MGKRRKARHSRSYAIGRTVPGTAEELGITAYIVKALIKAGQLKTKMVAKQEIVPHAEIARLKAEMT